MKVEYRLLHDIVEKSLSAKAGSFDVVTMEKFEIMVAISVGIKLRRDKRPLATIAGPRTGGAVVKRKLILAPSDSESTVSLPLPEKKKKLRTKRPKLVKSVPAVEEKAASKEFSLGVLIDYLASNSCLAPTGITRTPGLHVGRSKSGEAAAAAACTGGGGDEALEEKGAAVSSTLGITDSACKNQLVVVSVQYGPFNPYIPIRSTTIGKSRVAKDPIAMHTSWRSDSDITSVTSTLARDLYTIVYSDNIGYPRMSASGESSTTMHRLLHASGPHPIPPPNDPK
ncbi:hypothetical protein F511_11142 [Dorcoceras hygrometricum]|nr:hypothetical protein F511_11142 [Dorcoceras hygrometricum]